MRIGLLGTLEVLDDEGEPVRVGGQRVRTLLTCIGDGAPAITVLPRSSPHAVSGRTPAAMTRMVRVKLTVPPSGARS